MSNLVPLRRRSNRLLLPLLEREAMIAMDKARREPSANNIVAAAQKWTAYQAMFIAEYPAKPGGRAA